MLRESHNEKKGMLLGGVEKIHFSADDKEKGKKGEHGK
jgi:hypothetical protein